MFRLEGHDTKWVISSAQNVTVHVYVVTRVVILLRYAVVRQYNGDQMQASANAIHVDPQQDIQEQLQM